MIAHLLSCIDHLNHVAFIGDESDHFRKVFRIAFDREECLMELLIGFGLRRHREKRMN